MEEEKNYVLERINKWYFARFEKNYTKEVAEDAISSSLDTFKNVSTAMKFYDIISSFLLFRSLIIILFSFFMCLK